MTPQEALQAIDGLEKFGMNLGLERIRLCLAFLGEPQLRYPTVHVGGTNGKGSTCAFLASVLSRSGRKVGLYTSPPLEHFGERLRIDGECLPEELVPALLEEVLAAGRAHAALQAMTQFEVITAMAFLYFAREGVDAAVIEVGLGGRLDSTNVLSPSACVVTNVGLEHAEHLGPAVADIAREKAGIAKPGIPLVTAAEGEALEALEAEARRRGAPVLALGREFFVEPESPGALAYRGRRRRFDGLRPGLPGGYQRPNVAVALAAVEVLEDAGWMIPEDAVRAGIASASWPGRLEVLRARPGSPGPAVVLDGAHNPHASRVLARALAEDLPHERLFLVLGVLGDKDARSILADLLPLGDRVFFTRSSSRRALDPSELEGLATGLGRAPGAVVATVGEALDRALAEAGEADLVCVTGSLTTVGEARSHLRSLAWLR
ncbi:MAG: bifunctional folylpolyglutamate synthase/dihydrofolate synthase [Deltaproteobacteria bacterium]|nr:bifunctional folylpolyglutamate synthase/dihydrofolate synthase [Deltaproteobacteria bacterium]